MLFADAVHPTHAARPAGCWAPSQEKLAIDSRRVGVNASTFTARSTWRPGKLRMIEALTIDAASTIRLLQSIEGSSDPMLALHPCRFLDNARYHHAKLVQEWLAQPGRRIKLHFIPTYCLGHLNPIVSGYGASCTETSRTISATQLALNSPMRRSVFCVKRFRGIGPTSVIRSPTTSASSTQRIFGS